MRMDKPTMRSVVTATLLLLRLRYFSSLRLMGNPRVLTPAERDQSQHGHGLKHFICEDA